MFCSNCGKTIPESSEKCGFCGCPVGESDFKNTDFTSAQMLIYPNQYKKTYRARTTGAPAPRSEYHVEDAAPESAAPDARTVYVQDDVKQDENYGRTAREIKKAAQDPFGENEKPEDTPKTEPAAVESGELSEAARNSLDEVDRELVIEDVDMSQFEVEPVVSKERPEVPDEVESLIRELEKMPKPRATGTVYGDNSAEETEEDTEEEDTDEVIDEVEEVDEEEYVDDGGDSLEDEEDEEEEKPRKRKKLKLRARRKKARDEEELEEYTTEEDTGRPANNQSDDFDEDDPFDEEDEEEENGGSKMGKAGKIILAIVLIAAVVFGGVKWFDSFRSAQRGPVLQGVDSRLYENGIALITKHASAEYAQDIAAAYTGEGGSLDALSSALNTSSAELSALMPAEPSATDTLFMQALQKIETNIANCITADALAAAQNDADSKAQSGKRWTIVNNSIAMLKVAATEDDLNKIINDQLVDAATLNATPSPRPAVNYNTLSKGDATPAVWDLQNRLYALGYLLDDRDGTYGSKTQTAVKMFQQAVGLPTTGVADEVTLNAIYADDAPRTSYAQSEDVIAASLTTSTPVPATPVPQTTQAPAVETPAEAPAA